VDWLRVSSFLQALQPMRPSLEVPATMRLPRRDPVHDWHGHPRRTLFASRGVQALRGGRVMSL